MGNLKGEPRKLRLTPALLLVIVLSVLNIGIAWGDDLRAAAGFVPDPPMTISIAPDTYLRVLCEDGAAAMVLIPGTQGEGWAICPEVSK